MLHSWPMVLLMALLLSAVAIDLRHHRIPNALVLTGSALALSFHALACSGLLGAQAALAGPHWWSALAGWAAGLACLMPLYVVRAIGAGDVKLMAMVGAFVGAGTAMTSALYGLLAGGVLSLTLLAAHAWRTRGANGPYGPHGSLRLRAFTTNPLRDTALRIPYALPLSAGTATALLLQR